MSTPPPSPPPASHAPPGWPAPPDPPERPAGVVPVSGRPAWPPATAFLAIMLGLAGAIFGGLVLGIVGAAFGADLSDPPPSIAILGTVVQDLCFVGAVVFFASRTGALQPWQLGLRPTRFRSAAGWAALLLLVLVVFGVIWGQITGHTDAEKLPESLGADQSDWALAGTAILVTIFAPIGEELLFRGYVFPALRNWRGLWPAAVITGLLFGLLHVLSSPIYAIVPLALFGTLLCLLYQRTGSIYACMAVHSLNNCIAFGGAADVGWDWQIPLLAIGAMSVLALLARGVQARFGRAPAELSPV